MGKGKKTVEEGTVKIAVRVRPFNKREKRANASLIIRMANLEGGAKTFVTDPDSNEERDFAYDFAFQSHSKEIQGIGPHATQDTVMETLGVPVLNTALEGKNICLFAYGQTGAGKSFSMLGKIAIPELQGIVPRVCNRIFEMIAENKDPNVKYSIEIQVIEIYCEMINDLLANRKNWPRRGHRPKLTPKDGYVAMTIRKPCNSFEEINKAIQFADKNRSVGSHALNPESSRAHTIYTIHYKKMTQTPGSKTKATISARMNLVDLAGSERTSSAGTSGQMLKEGNAINLSLTALGGCIKSLAEGKKAQFRTSKLTLMLQGSMTNGLVVMIAAVSPASICYPETVSTLRFADRVKTVKVKAVSNVTEDPVAEIKKEMAEMKARLEAEIVELQKQASGQSDGSMDEAEEAAMKAALQKEREEVERLKAEMEEMANQQIEEEDESDDAKAQRAYGIDREWSVAIRDMGKNSSLEEPNPHFANLHCDDRLSLSLVYPFEVGSTLIGKKDEVSPPKIEFNGLGIHKGHCIVERTEDGHVWLEARNGRSLVNGKAVQRVELKHNDRVWLGTAYAFLFKFPGKEAEGTIFPEDDEFDYLDAEEEISAQQQQKMGKGLEPKIAEKLSAAINSCKQANMIAMELGAVPRFTPKLSKVSYVGGDGLDVLVAVAYGGTVLLWPWEKFSARLTYMTDRWQEHDAAVQKNETLPPLAPLDDPFIDLEPQFIGEGHLVLSSLANMIDFETTVAVLGVNNVMQGQSVRFAVRICDVTLQEDARLGTPRYRDCFVRYRLGFRSEVEDDDDSVWSVSKPVNGLKKRPVFDFKTDHTMEVDDDVLRHLQKGSLRIQIFGKLVPACYQGIVPKIGTDAQVKYFQDLLGVLKEETVPLERPKVVNGFEDLLNAYMQMQAQVTPDGRSAVKVLENFLTPGDEVEGFSPNGYQPSHSPSNERPAKCLVDSGKYLNFQKEGAGIIVTPKHGATVVCGIALTSANDYPVRDPASWAIYGSNGGDFTEIATGFVPTFKERFERSDLLTFDNDTRYTKYKVVFPTVRDSGKGNSVQIQKIELFELREGKADVEEHLRAKFAEMDVNGNGVVERNELLGGMVTDFMGVLCEMLKAAGIAADGRCSYEEFSRLYLQAFGSLAQRAAELRAGKSARSSES
uniref:Kinesin-like protein n=1 Tax=Eutreptiella gymnastica TaxID=73025 RepID=A0A7S4G3I3_9EUGL